MVVRDPNATPGAFNENYRCGVEVQEQKVNFPKRYLTFNFLLEFLIFRFFKEYLEKKKKEEEEKEKEKK